MRVVKAIFLIAGVYGVVLVTPLYFMEQRIGEDYPPPITHPEYFYGFVGTVLAWQLMYLLIGTDPIRYRRCMLLAVAAKASFAAAAAVLFSLARIPSIMFALAMIDAVLAMFFMLAWFQTPRA
jgi:hypothetical protein